MRRILLTVTTVLLGLLGMPADVSAATSKATQFILPIVPIECTIETIATGSGPMQIITCPEPPEPEPEPEPETPGEEPELPGEITPRNPRYRSILLKSLGELPPGAIQRPIETPGNRRFGIQIDRPHPQPKPDYVTPLLAPLVILSIILSALMLRKLHSRLAKQRNA